MVQVLATKAEFDALLARSGTRAVVVDFTATWCGPCQRIAPAYEALSKDLDHATFCKVDVDANQETAEACGIRAMPTFKIFKSGAEVETIQGADEAALRQAVLKHAGEKEKFVGAGSRLGGSANTSSGVSEREKRLAALERRGLGGGGATPAQTAPAVPTPAPAPPPAAPPAMPPRAPSADADDAMMAAAIAASLGQDTTTGAMDVTDAGSAPPAPMYAAQQEQLVAMGFGDATANRVALEAAHGNVERALEMLM